MLFGDNYFYCLKIMKLKIFLLICLLSFGVFAQTDKRQTTPGKTEPLKVGTIAPDFTLKDQNGKELKLSKVRKNTMLVFYRGYW